MKNRNSFENFCFMERKCPERQEGMYYMILKLSFISQIAMNSEVWLRLATELKRRLEKLMCFAGISGTASDVTNSSFSSNQNLDDSAIFMDELKSIAKLSSRSVETLISSIKKNNETHDGHVSDDLQKKLYGQWPRNSDEYKMYLMNQRNNRQEYLSHSPKKSALRSSTVPREEKKVRFDVEYDSISESYIENIDIVDV